MLRTQSTANQVRTLTQSDRDEALDLCARDPEANVFVAGRILEGALITQPGALLGFAGQRGLRSVCWASANVVPVGCDAEALSAFAAKVRRWRRQCASLFGARELVLPLWEELGASWGPARSVRAHQPLMSVSVLPSVAGLPLDRAVRRASPAEVDAVLPAAAAMFTEEIGYPPYWGSSAAYRQGIGSLVARGHTFVRIEGGEVVFKADVGSVALGVAQIQGVWLAPAWRGRGLAEPAMAAVVDTVLREIAPVASLYVNDFNAPARATYKRVGFTEVGSFATVLM